MSTSDLIIQNPQLRAQAAEEIFPRVEDQGPAEAADIYAVGGLFAETLDP